MPHRVYFSVGKHRHTLKTYNFYLIIILSIAFSIIGCNSSKTFRSIHNEKTDKRGNQEIQTGDVVDISDNSETKIIFNGENNTVIFEYLNAFFNDKNSRDVIIIEGDGNTIKLTFNHSVQNKVNSTDTIQIKGNYNYIELLHSYFISGESSTDFSFEGDSSFQIIEYNKSNIELDTVLIENKYNHKWSTAKEVFDFYLKKSITGDLKSAFYIGEMYHTGMGTEADFSKAIYYYKIAAKAGFADAQNTMGYLYSYDFDGINRDIEKAKYWYRKAAAQGDESSIAQLKQLGEY